MPRLARTSAYMNARTSQFMLPMRARWQFKGLDGYKVAEKNGQLLVCSLKEEQRIKEFGKQRTIELNIVNVQTSQTLLDSELLESLRENIILQIKMGGGHSDRENTSSHSEQRSEDYLRRWYYIMCVGEQVAAKYQIPKNNINFKKLWYNLFFSSASYVGRRGWHISLSIF